MSWSRLVRNDLFGEAITFDNTNLRCSFTFYPSSAAARRVILEYIDSPDHVLHNKFKRELGPKLSPWSGPDDRVRFAYDHENQNQHANDIAKFISLFLDQHNLWGTKISTELHSLCGLRKPEKEISDSLVAMVNDNNIEGAIAESQKYQRDMYYEAIWELAVYLSGLVDINDTKISIDKLHDLYDSISEKNPHFKEAQDAMQQILMQKPVNKDNEIHLLEKKFKIALSTDQTVLADRLFDQLCGRPFSSETGVNNVRGDFETLCQIASQMRAMNEKIKSLQSEINQLRTESGMAVDSRAVTVDTGKTKQPSLTTEGVFKTANAPTTQANAPVPAQKSSPSLDRKKE